MVERLPYPFLFPPSFPGSHSVWPVGDPLLDQSEAGVLEDAGDLDTVLHCLYFCYVQGNQKKNQH